MNAVTILYFAWLRDRTGHAEETLELPVGVTTIADLIAHLRARGGGYEAAFSLGRVIRAAVNQDFAAPDTAIAAGDEIAFFPPVTGG
jgi:molybdopterin synthase sulfur carrier subunit